VTANLVVVLIHMLFASGTGVASLVYIAYDRRMLVALR
jgi:hypothetical protein